jgi:hypothetical protein
MQWAMPDFPKKGVWKEPAAFYAAAFRHFCLWRRQTSHRFLVTPTPGSMSSTDVSSRRWPASMRALAHRNFRFYFAGQAVSILGSCSAGVPVVAGLSLTGSAALLGVTSFCALIPLLLVGRWPGPGSTAEQEEVAHRRAVLAGLQAFLLAFLTWADLIGPR